MTRSRRPAALIMLVVVALALLSTPAAAAPAGVEGSVSLRNFTMPAGGNTVEESLAVLLFADQAGWADSVTLTVDTSKVAVAETKVGGQGCSGSPVVRCVLKGPHRVYENPKTQGYFSYSAEGLVWLSLTPKPGAAAGDTGTLSVGTQVEDGPTTTETASIRIGEGVNLTAVDEKPQTVAPGGAVTMQPKVRNSGGTAVGGLTAVFSGDEGALEKTNYSNCTYGFSIACTFDTTLTPGATYQVSAPFTVRVPGDAVASSRTALGVQWLTTAEWEDLRGDLPADPSGTGAGLELEEVAQSAAGTPQADLDHDDNGSDLTATVTGARRTDLKAFGAVIPGRPGDHRITVGLVSEGPGTLRFPPFLNNIFRVTVTLPATVSVVTADDRCVSSSDGEDLSPTSAPDEPVWSGPPTFYCGLGSFALKPGQRTAFAFTVRVARPVHDAEAGSMEFTVFDDGVSVDRDPRNNRADISLTATAARPALPITGTVAATLSVAGILLLLAGVIVVATMSRSRRDEA